VVDRSPMTRPTSSLWARIFRGTTGRGSWYFLQRVKTRQQTLHEILHHMGVLFTERVSMNWEN